MYTNIIHNDDICNYFLKNQQFIFNSLGNCRECRIHGKTLMLFDILDLCLVNLAFASKAGSSPATPTTKELFDIMELPYFDINLYNIIAY